MHGRGTFCISGALAFLCSYRGLKVEQATNQGVDVACPGNVTMLKVTMLKGYNVVRSHGLSYTGLLVRFCHSIFSVLLSAHGVYSA